MAALIANIALELLSNYVTKKGSVLFYSNDKKRAAQFECLRYWYPAMTHSVRGSFVHSIFNKK